MKILIIDDEATVRELAFAYLEPEGYVVRSAADGPSGLALARSFRPDLVVLDVMLPGLDGIQLLQRLRRDSQAYVIMLSARAEEIDKVTGLAVGADDYMTKPFSPRELVARIKAAFRRLNADPQTEHQVLRFERLTIDLGSRSVWMDGREISLTGTEFELLRVLAQHPRLVLSREQLLALVWGADYYGEERVVDVHLGHIRQKLGDHGLIQTVRGFGFRFEDEPQ